MKKRMQWMIGLIFLICMGVFGSQPVKAASVSTIKWSNVSSKKTIYRGHKATFKVKITPTSAAKAALTWTSSKKSVATVSSKGTITPKKNGTTYITCKVKAKPSKKVTCKVTVKTQKAKSIVISSAKPSVQKGKTVYIKGAVLPTYTYNRGITYKSSNTKIATVSSSGKVTGKAVGSAVIKMTAKDGSKKTKSYHIYVVKALSKTSTKFIAHRGLSSVAPENTLKAFQLAGQAGFWGAECDVRMTKDKEFIILHDATFQRMCGVNKKPEDMTLEEIKKLKIISGNGYSTYKNYTSATTIPTLEEYLQICKNYNLVPVIEIKMEYTNDGSQTYESFQEVVKSDMQSLHNKTKTMMGSLQYKYIAYDLETLIQLNSIVHAEDHSNISMEHVVNYPSTGNINFYKNREIGVASQYNNMSTATLKAFNNAGVSTNVWTPDDPKTVWNFINAGISSVTTNTKFW